MKKFITENKQIVKFFAIAGLVYLSWFLLYDLYLMKDGVADDWLTSTITDHAVFVLSIFNFDAAHIVGSCTKHAVSIENVRMLGISNACNGQVLYPLFAGFVLATPGKWKNKSLMISTGIIGIYLVNLLRVVLLIIIRYYEPNYLDFNHKYTFVVLVYSFIFSLWMIWTNKVAKLNLEWK